MTKPTYQVRRATLWDLGPLELLLKKGIAESNGLLPDYDRAHVYHAAVNQIETGLIFIASGVDEANKREKIVGCLSLDLQGWTWAPDKKLLRSVHFYILPEARGQLMPDGKTLIWEAMVEAGQWLADEIGLMLFIEILHQLGPDNRAAAKDELLKRKGLAYAGGTWGYLPKAKQAQAAE